ncbi:hypothetical protein [Vibrio variabilis]|uniref:hypothetical protein n=1 Tax=Vibrio variabilis TaxID=990271 RepID=UPI000DD965D4|nr:hypothetical protein [Vibrio variabilis]
MEIDQQSPVEDSQLVKWLTNKLGDLASAPQVNAEALDRSDIFELSKVISDFFAQEHVAHNDKNYAIVYGLITGYRADQAVSHQEMLDYLSSCVFLFQN